VDEEGKYGWGVAVYNKYVYLGRVDPKEGRFQQLNVETKELLPKQLFVPAQSAFLFVGQTMDQLLHFVEQYGACLDTAEYLLGLPEGTIVAHPACGNNGAAKIVSASYDPPGVTIAPAEAKKSAFTSKWTNQIVIVLEDLSNIRVITDTSDNKPQEETDVHGKVLALATDQINHKEARPWKLGPGVVRCLREGGGWLKISTGQKKVDATVKEFKEKCPKVMKRLTTGDQSFPKSIDPEIQECIDYVALQIAGRIGRNVVHSEAERWADDQKITANNPLSEVALSGILAGGGFNHMVPQVAVDEEKKRRSGVTSTGPGTTSPPLAPVMVMSKQPNTMGRKPRTT